VSRPDGLRRVALDEATVSGRVVTMSRGQWDSLLAAAYEAGWTLLELDEHEKPVRAFRKGSRDDHN
jgi:hypothetical protein